MESVAGEQEAGATLPGDVKIGEFCSSDIQVAINEGNRQRHAFFVVKMGKTGVAMPYQQVIPSYFAKYHPTLHLEDITLERPCGRSWGLTIRPLNNTCRFGKGWKQFSLENQLREGHQLLFHLVGKSRFVVHFFDHLGKSVDSFLPPTPMPEACAKDEEDAASVFAKPQLESPFAKPPPMSVAKPLPQFETPVAAPSEDPVAAPLESTPVAAPLESTPFAAPLESTPVAKFPTKPKAPRPRTPGLNSDDAKVILRQFFTQVRPNMSTDGTSAQEMTEDIDVSTAAKQGSYEEHAMEESQAYMFLDSDDDGKPVKQESPIRSPIGRDFVQESYSQEQAGFHSPEEVRTPRVARNMMPVGYVEQDDPLGRSKSYGGNQHLERQRAVRKEASTRRASWESKPDHDAPAAKRDGHGHRGTNRDLYEEKISSSTNGYREDHGVSHYLSPAKVLLTQQGCLSYSEIVSKRRRGFVTDESRQRLLAAATRFAASLKNENFLVAMKGLHVYHKFHLSIPRDFSEATGTLRASKVRVCLMDDQRNCYETKWKWHASCPTPFLSCDGWALFALDHVLEEGDVCVFELVDRSPPLLLSVHIFRCVVETTGRESSTRGGQSASLNHNKFGRQAAATDQGIMRETSSRKRPIVDLGRPGVQKTIQKPRNLQAWTKLFKPRFKAQFGDRPGQRRS